MTPDRPASLMSRLPRRLRGLAGLWLQVAGTAAAVSLLFGPYRPLMITAVLLTIGLPILALVLWGQALDEQMDNSRHHEEGPW